VKVTDPEVQRIRRVYSQRSASGRYDHLRPDVVDALAARNRAWAAPLFACGRRPGATLEVGCGDGGPLRWLHEAGASPAIGVDLQEDRLAAARASGGQITVAAADGRHLPFRDKAFSTAVCSVLFSSILDDEVAVAVAAEITRVVGPGGVVLWFDMVLPNPRNRDVRPVGRDDLRRLFPGARQELRRCVLVPPVARRLAGRPLASSLLATLPPLRSHLAGAIWLP
jgi:ubiquinone/menaquinone biosynthesis C-methylase UbiE